MSNHTFANNMIKKCDLALDAILIVMKKKIVFVALLLAALTAVSVYFARKNAEDYFDASFGIYAFKAGKADSFLVETDGGFVLIDAGEKEMGEEIVNKLAEDGIDYLDYVIVTHFDKDHVGGMSKVLKNIEVGTVLQSNYSKNSGEYAKYSAALAASGASAVTVTDDYSFELGGAHFVVNGPAQEEYADSPSNNSSLITEIEYGDLRFLFMGDAEEARVAEFIDNNNQKYDFVKMPYHGAHLANLDEFLDNVSPKYALITSSDEELESVETTSALRLRGVKYYLTRQQNWVFVSDGKKIKVE